MNTALTGNILLDILSTLFFGFIMVFMITLFVMASIGIIHAGEHKLGKR